MLGDNLYCPYMHTNYTLYFMVPGVGVGGGGEVEWFGLALLEIGAKHGNIKIIISSNTKAGLNFESKSHIKHKLH